MPAKSGVSGIIYVIVPGVMGISVLAPPLDRRGNSSRGIDFCKRVLKEWRLGIFEQLVNGTVDFSVRGALKLGTTPRKSEHDAAGAPGASPAAGAPGARQHPKAGGDGRPSAAAASDHLARATAIFLRMKAVAARLLKLFRRFRSLGDPATGRLTRLTMMRLLRQQNMEANPSVLRQVEAAFGDRDALESFDQLFLLHADIAEAPADRAARQHPTGGDGRSQRARGGGTGRSTNHLVKVLLSGVAIKDFPQFRASCTETYEQSRICWYQMQQQMQQEESEQDVKGRAAAAAAAAAEHHWPCGGASAGSGSGFGSGSRRGSGSGSSE